MLTFSKKSLKKYPCMSKIQGCPRKDCLLIVKINMKRVVICGNMNVGEIEGLIQNVYLVFKYDAIVFLERNR